MILAAPAPTNRRLRVGIYARHSSDKQSVTSSADQAAACEELVARLGGEVVGVYTDPEISGYRRDRPGLLAMLAEVRAGTVDMLVCEALDRIARDGEDINWIGKKLRFDHVRLVTATEGEIDEVKLAVAGLLGSMFLTNLRHKTFRGMKAAVLAGRLAGGKAYGYRRVNKLDDHGEIVRGIFEIDEEHAAIVRRIYRDFAAGKSSIAIATLLNNERVPSPRGGEWNASTIRGDPKKRVGILNNPLYRGQILWGRREWRKDPDSDKRERRYRIRDEAEWVTVSVPDLRIVDENLAAAVEAEIARRALPPAKKVNAGRSNPAKYLLSGIIKCGTCGSSYTILGKGYYRCARNHERGTCDNKASVQVDVVEAAALSALQSQLLTPDLVKLFVEEFTREVARASNTRDEHHQRVAARLAELNREIDNLAANMLTGVVSPAVTRMLAEREHEKAQLERELARNGQQQPVAVLPHPVLMRQFKEKVSGIQEALADPEVRGEAAEIVRSLIERVTIHVGEDGVEAEVEASLSSLVGFAVNANPALPDRERRGCCCWLRGQDLNL